LLKHFIWTLKFDEKQLRLKSFFEEHTVKTPRGNKRLIVKAADSHNCTT